jgi:hypothetical protein
MNFYDELTHDLIRLQSLIGALDVVHDTGSVAGDGMDCGPHVRGAYRQDRARRDERQAMPGRDGAE